MEKSTKIQYEGMFTEVIIENETEVLCDALVEKTSELLHCISALSNENLAYANRNIFKIQMFRYLTDQRFGE